MTPTPTAEKPHPSRGIQFIPSRMPGCYVVQFPVAQDHRGHFVKSIQRSVFEARGLEADFRECFFTTSYSNVLRGMHFQLPPSDHAKLVIARRARSTMWPWT